MFKTSEFYRFENTEILVVQGENERFNVSGKAILITEHFSKRITTVYLVEGKTQNYEKLSDEVCVDKILLARLHVSYSFKFFFSVFNNVLNFFSWLIGVHMWVV